MFDVPPFLGHSVVLSAPSLTILPLGCSAWDWVPRGFTQWQNDGPSHFSPYTVLKMPTIFLAYFCTICQGNTRSLSCNWAAGKQSFDYFPFALRLATLKLIWHYRWNQALPKRDFLQPFRRTLIVWEISASSRILRFHCSFIFQVNDDVSVMVIQ